jgi:hypothetical protein
MMFLSQYFEEIVGGQEVECALALRRVQPVFFVWARARGLKMRKLAVSLMLNVCYVKEHC